MSLNRKLKREIANRPKYEVDGTYAENQAITRNQAYGRAPGAVAAERNIGQGLSDTVAAAQSASNDSAAILASIASANQAANQSRVQLSDQEMQARSANAGQMMAANNQMAEEKDKAWNFNVNEPYQNRIQSLRDRKKARQELTMKGIDAGIAAITMAGDAAKKVATGGIA